MSVNNHPHPQKIVVGSHMSDVPVAIRACFAEWRMVKTRKVLALIFEVPLEQQADVLTILGAPMPDAEIWCGIARLVIAPQVTTEDAPPAQHAKDAMVGLGKQARAQLKNFMSSERAKIRYANASPGEKAVTRAAMLCKDPRFMEWCGGVTEEDARRHVLEECGGIASRSVIAVDEDAFRLFQAMETDFQIYAGHSRREQPAGCDRRDQCHGEREANHFMTVNRTPNRGSSTPK